MLIQLRVADDEVEIEDMQWDEDKMVYHYPCPCGDRFEITRVSSSSCCCYNLCMMLTLTDSVFAASSKSTELIKSYSPSSPMDTM
jgi:hypothetical protein